MQREIIIHRITVGPCFFQRTDIYVRAVIADPTKPARKADYAGIQAGDHCCRRHTSWVEISHLLEIVKTFDGHCFGLGLARARQKERRQNADDGDDQQQFNQGKPDHKHSFWHLSAIFVSQVSD